MAIREGFLGGVQAGTVRAAGAGAGADADDMSYLLKLSGAIIK
jgi:hypothetical protein